MVEPVAEPAEQTHRTRKQIFLLEIGTEELPAADLADRHGASLEEAVPVMLDRTAPSYMMKLVCNPGTPRRLVVSVSDLANRLRQPAAGFFTEGERPACRRERLISRWQARPLLLPDFARSKGDGGLEILKQEDDRRRRLYLVARSPRSLGRPVLKCFLRKTALADLIAGIR